MFDFNSKYSKVIDPVSQTIQFDNNKYIFNVLRNNFMFQVKNILGNIKIMNEFFFGNSIIRGSLLYLQNNLFIHIKNSIFHSNMGAKGTAIYYSNISKIYSCVFIKNK